MKLRVPATSANLGAGFDVFGMALEAPFDIIEVEKSQKTEITIKGRSSEHIPTDPRRNTAGLVAEILGKPIKRIISLMQENIGIVAVHPEIVVSTRIARAALPRKVPLHALSFNIGSAAGMVMGIVKNDINLIGESMENLVIEETRSKFIKGYFNVKKSAIESGAAGVTISGSGPTMLAVCRMKEREKVAKAMLQAFSEKHVKCEAFITTVGKGVEIIE